MITAEDIKVIYSLAGEIVSTSGKLNDGEVHPQVLQFTQEEYDAMLAYELQRALNADLEAAYEENLATEASLFEQAANGNYSEELLNAFRAMLGADI